MKARSEYLKQVDEKKDSVNIDRIKRRDVDSLNHLKCKAEQDLHETEDAIEDYLSNPQLTLNEQFLLLLKVKADTESQLLLIKEAIELV